MKLYLKDGNVLQVNDNTFLVVLNLDEFIDTLKKGTQSSENNYYILRYILTVNGEDYLGSSKYDPSSGFINNIEKACPYKVKLVTWHIAGDAESYLEFAINN